MKTHEFAKALRAFATLLERAPNMRIEDTHITSQDVSQQNNQLALSISALVSLSSVGKPQLVSFINEMDYPIEIKPTQSSRDVIGKLLNYLEQNEIARNELKKRVESSKEAQASPELLKALSSLLKGGV